MHFALFSIVHSKASSVDRKKWPSFLKTGSSIASSADGFESRISFLLICIHVTLQNDNQDFVNLRLKKLLLCYHNMQENHA